MKKLAIIAVAAASILSASTAYVDYWYNGIYYVTCGWAPSFNGPVWVRG